MPNTLIVSAGNWEPKRVGCTFTVKANGVPLKPLKIGPEFFDLPSSTTALEITATPIDKLYWGDTFQLTLTGGTFVPARPGFVNVLNVPLPLQAFTLVVCNLSRFRDASSDVLATLASPPSPRSMPPSSDARLIQPWDMNARRTSAEASKVDEKAVLAAQYGSWPPTTWEIPSLSTATYVDRQNLVSAGGLNFPTQTSQVVPNDDTAVLELRQARSPRLFGVTWPRAIAPAPGVVPSILMFLRQTSGQNLVNGVFTPRTTDPFSFDYAERCLVESMRYGRTAVLQTVPPQALAGARVWSDNPANTLRPKGVPYQVAKSGANVVTVYPVAAAAAGGEYGGLANTELIPAILGELQAFMFWRKGVSKSPTSIGKVAISVFSSANYTLLNWLKSPRNLNGKFMKKTLVALYLLDPPTQAADVVAAAMKWATMGSNKRVRLYGRGVQAIPNDPNNSTQDRFSDIHEKLGEWKGQPAHPATPYVLSTQGNTRTAALLPLASWQALFTKLGLNPIGGWDVHHLIPATMLTHALAQGDL